MKRTKKFVAVLLIAALGIFQTSCIGSFSLTSSLHSWNSNVGSKIVNELVFLAMVIIPVYEVTIFVDGIVLNTIEFWSGENPMAMQDGETDTKIVRQNGVKYRVTASKNRFDFEQLKGSEKGTKGSLVYNPETQSWSYEGENQSFKLVEMADNGTANVFLPDGEVMNVQANGNGLALLKSVVETEDCLALQ